MPSHTPEEQERRQRKGKTPKRSRNVTGGNRQTGKLREAFQTARQKVRGAANIGGKVTRAVTQETGGLAREFGRGLTGRGATPAGGGAQAATSETAAQRLGERAKRLFSRGPRAAQATTAGTAPGGGFTRAEAARNFEAGQRGGRGIRAARTVGRGAAGIGRFARGLALPGAAIAIGTEAATTTQAEKETASGLPQVVPLRGQQPGGQAPGAQAPVNLERFADPLLAAARPAVGVLRGAFGLGAEQDISPTGEPVASTPAGVRAPQFGEEGERLFTNADIGGGAANRGLASVEENQAVAGRLEARGIAERQGGLRAAAQPGAPGAPPGGRESSDLLNRLGAQAAGGGLASAFGALNVGGNVLRREAADRTRANEAQVAATDAGNKLNLELTKIGAKNAVDTAKSFAKDTVSLTESFNDALESGNDQQIANVRSAIFTAAKEQPDGPAAGAAKNLLAEDIRDNTESGFFGALFNPFGAGRGPLDLLKSAGQGGFNNEFQSAVDKLVLNEATGDLEIANPDGSGGRQFVTNIENLTPESRDFLSQAGIRTLGAGQEVTRGDPNRQDPNRPSLRSGL